MSDFDARWQQLVATARRGAGDERALDPRQTERLAQLAFAARRQHEPALQWPRLALAAGVFVAALAGIGLGAESLGMTSQLDFSVRELASLPRRVPAIAFLPAPPGPEFFGVPELAGASPAPLFLALDRILVPRNDPETLP
ncbi:MAG TPA: hypothetical protein VK843_14820 [Planctomycetota bacterium]|nr:hypothetical protein [Planctomycetota bacterium]